MFDDRYAFRLVVPEACSHYNCRQFKISCYLLCVKDVLSMPFILKIPVSKTSLLYIKDARLRTNMSSVNNHKCSRYRYYIPTDPRPLATLLYTDIVSLFITFYCAGELMTIRTPF